MRILVVIRRVSAHETAVADQSLQARPDLKEANLAPPQLQTLSTSLRPARMAHYRLHQIEIHISMRLNRRRPSRR
jgi:hypothetical protein